MWVGLQLAIMDIMATHLTPARPTDITVLTGLPAESLSAPGRGMVGAAVGADGGVVGVMAAVGVMDAAATATDAATMAHADMGAAQSADTVAADIAPPVADSMAEAVSTVEAEVAFTVVEAGMAAEADIANRRAPAFWQ